jgi:rhamnogalacturonyl hydrolase YesR
MAWRGVRCPVKSAGALCIALALAGIGHGCMPAAPTNKHMQTDSANTLTNDTGAQLAARVLRRVQQADPVWGNYAIDLTFDALLEVYLATGDATFRDYVLAVMARRNMRPEEPVPYVSQPFGHLNYMVWRVTGDQRIAAGFVAASRTYLRDVPRSADGLIEHRAGKDAPPRVLVDALQDYVARMARTGALTGETNFFSDAALQARRYRNLLHMPANGLWRQGRGWEPRDATALSPGAWSRGQGWLLRGLTDALAVMPRGTPEYIELRGYTCELLDSLLPLQDANGMWHCLPDRPWSASEPETSGTALIVAALYRMLAGGHATNAQYRAAADKGFAALTRCVDDSGVVHGACVGPGPLTEELLQTRYLDQKFAEAEDHGWFSVLYACAAQLAAGGK